MLILRTFAEKGRDQSHNDRYFLRPRPGSPV